MERACQSARLSYQNYHAVVVKGTTRRGKQRKCWIDNIPERTNMDLQVLL